METIILSQIVELGFIRFSNGIITECIPPKVNLYYTKHDRWTSTIGYIKRQGAEGNMVDGGYFVCVFDGWREYSTYVDPLARRYVSWMDMSATEQAKFIGVGSAGEPRFRHLHEDAALYPVLPHPIIAYNRHIGDYNVQLIPDAEFITTRFAKFVDQVRIGDSPYEDKVGCVIWRGGGNIAMGSSYFDKHPRLVVIDEGRRAGIDASFMNTSISWMLGHKYILDIDGMVSAWSGLYWKLSSNSLVWKVRSHWEQWYYAKMIPWVHYVPLDDFKPETVGRLLQWCESNPEKCKAIVENANTIIDYVNCA